MEIQDFIIRLFVAAGAGMLLGLERQFQQKSAGLRTNMLVALGSALYVMISINLLENNTSGDPSRVVGQVVTGIGFLGAGVILQQGTNVKGLTTAATIWCSSAVGCLAATGRFLETGIVTGVIIFINLMLLQVEKWLDHKNRDRR